MYHLQIVVGNRHVLDSRWIVIGVHYKERQLTIIAMYGSTVATDHYRLFTGHGTYYLPASANQSLLCVSGTEYVVVCVCVCSVCCVCVYVCVIS